MDELNKGVRTYYQIHFSTYPTAFDSLIQVDDTALANPAALENLGMDNTVLALDSLTAAQYTSLFDIGIDALNYVALDQNPAGDDNCSNEATDATAGLPADQRGLRGLIRNIEGGNAVVAGNIFLSANGNGCGVKASMTDDMNADGTADDPGITVSSQAAGAAIVTTTAAGDPLPVMMWMGGAERLTGQAESGTSYNTEGNTAFMAVGLGPASTLFNANEIGGLTSVPVYRHVARDEYNRFIAIFDIGSYDSGNDISMAAQASLVAIVDGAGDTKEEELGEWDGTRNTI